MNLPIEKKKVIKTNKLLKSEGPRMSIENFLKFKEFFEIIKEKQNEFSDEIDLNEMNSLENMSLLSEHFIKSVYNRYGEEGLFKLHLLMMSHDKFDFKHFYEYLKGDIFFPHLIEESEPLQLDNDFYKANEKLLSFDISVLQPSMSRKLYNPGRQQGYFVYGIGGPRILVSHPFQGMNSDLEIYDIYNNSVDVVSSLNLRGYFGSFLFLDYHGGLNYKIKDVQAWTLWFSYIAIHSDLVIFVKEHEHGFSDSQKLEINFTCDRVQKKVVEIPHSELRWAKTAVSDAKTQRYFGKNGEMTREEFYNEAAELPNSLLHNFSTLNFPKDRIIVIEDEGNISEWPINYPCY